jgi:cyclophilin family peptidyl-prolyl cis-trans isomerase
VLQAGDVTRGDGSGGESIYGPTFGDEKEGLKRAYKWGSVGMASGGGKGTNSSQVGQGFLGAATCRRCQMNSVRIDCFVVI